MLTWEAPGAVVDVRKGRIFPEINYKLSMGEYLGAETCKASGKEIDALSKLQLDGTPSVTAAQVVTSIGALIGTNRGSNVFLKFLW